jgi:alkylation response protein AidB-like acyl-CoA dehydrogenase
VIETQVVRRGSSRRLAPGGVYAETLARFEEGLGDPEAPGPLSFAAAAERDRLERYPHDALEALASLGAHQLQIPAEQGGSLHSLEQLVAASYAVGRRDPSVSLSGGLQMWSQLLWMAGSDAQRATMRALLEGNVGICLGASEGDHGADLLSSSCRADRTGDGYVLRGQKWPIGCATECRVALILARTNPDRGPRSLSWFLLGPDALNQPTCRRLPKVPTVGMRASDVSGLAFDGLSLSPDSVVGEIGGGLELALKLFQVTRPLVASLSLGPGDTALRIATSFVLDRQLYGKSAADLPTVRRVLVRAWVDLLIAEVVAITTARGAHVDAEGLSVGSLVAKIIVPPFVNTAVDQASRVLGARSFMRDYAQGTFEKVHRDQRIVSILDGSTEVCLQALASQLPLLLGRLGGREEEQLALQSAAHAPVAALSYGDLAVAPRAAALAVRGLGPLVRRRAISDGDADRALRAVARYAAEEEARQPVVSTGTSHDRWGASRTAEMADAASAYAALYALAACAAFSLCNRGEGFVTERSSWLWMTARRLCAIPPEGSPPERDLVDDLFVDLRSRVEEQRLLSSLHSSGTSHG